jgi:hypothetical protein
MMEDVTDKVINRKWQFFQQVCHSQICQMTTAANIYNVGILIFQLCYNTTSKPFHNCAVVGVETCHISKGDPSITKIKLQVNAFL